MPGFRIILCYGLSGGRFGLWGLRFGLSIWGSMSLKVDLKPLNPKPLNPETLNP